MGANVLATMVVYGGAYVRGGQMSGHQLEKCGLHCVENTFKSLTREDFLILRLLIPL